MVDDKSDLNAQLGAQASRKEAAERDAKYEAIKMQNEKNRQIQQQRQDAWRRRGI